MVYKVYWLRDSKHAKFKSYEEAIEWAKTMTCEESTLNTAVIVAHRESRIESVIIVTWFYGDVWTVEHIAY